MDGYGTTVSVLQPYSVGRGFPQVKGVASPAAGAGFTYALTGSAVENLQAVAFRLVTSAVVANRVPVLDVLDGDGAVIASTMAGAAITASLTTTVSFWQGAGAFSGLTGARLVAPLPDLTLVAGLSVAVSVAAIDAGDQISAVRVFTEVFPTGPTGEPQGPITTAQP